VASLTKDSRKRSPYWICCYSSADGRQLKVSTKKKDRKQAWQFCLSIEHASQLAKDRLLTEQRAKKIIGEILERSTGGTLRNDTAEQWLTHWLDVKDRVRSRQTMLVYRQVIRNFLQSLGSKAALPLAHVTSRDVLRFRDSITAAGKTARTANLGLRVVSAALNAAFRQHLIDFNPAMALETLATRSVEKGTFTAQQISKLVAAADGDWRLAIMVGYYTGARISDVANLRWSAVDRDRKLLRFTAGKTKKLVTIPLHPRLEHELDEQLRRRPGIGKALLFPTLAGKGTGGVYGLSEQFHAVMDKAGIEVASTRNGRRAVSHLSFHSLRHSFNSAMANAGVAQEIRQKLTGHSSVEMNRVYTHHEIGSLRAAIEVLPPIK
jgi:integrase